MSRLPQDSGPNADTIDAAPSELSDPSQRRVHLVTGSGQHLSSETHALLRERIRIAAIVLAIGFALFLGRRLLGGPGTPEDGSAGESILFWMHLGTTLVLGLMAVALCRRCSMCPWTLRIAEAIVFGLPATFFLAANAFGLLEAADKHKLMPIDLEPWLMLIFVYAQFIPNTWRRAAVVISLIATAPIALRLVLLCSNGVCAVAAGGDAISTGTAALLMLVAGMAATIGVHTINHLREEAFRAKQLGQYRLKQLIGSGGMGEVYLAEHTLMKRPCAIKIIRPEKAGDPTVLARFEREVRASAKLSHWNSIDIYDYGRADDGTFYYVMEYLPGMSLHELVAKHGPLSPARVVYLLRQVCDALEEAHAAGIIHRDLKPANIFAAQRGGFYDVAKLLDFGLAKPMTTESENVELTQIGSVTGSPLFMSPEQATGEAEPDARSDIYSLGAVMYFLLTGRPPFEHEKPLKVLIAHASQAPVPPHELRADIPEDLEQVVLRCLEKRPDNRYQTALELANALADCAVADAWTRDDATRWWLAHGTASSLAPEPALV
jgi:tRNA A-37 threonylcarbamoyl transferase component Bud32